MSPWALYWEDQGRLIEVRKSCTKSWKWERTWLLTGNWNTIIRLKYGIWKRHAQRMGTMKAWCTRSLTWHAKKADTDLTARWSTKECLALKQHGILDKCWSECWNWIYKGNHLEHYHNSLDKRRQILKKTISSNEHGRKRMEVKEF